MESSLREFDLIGHNMGLNSNTATHEVWMNICEANKAASFKVKNFMQNVKDVKEESITDYLVWKWRELDKRFSYINTSTFTRQEENMRTGADFELELWLVGKKSHYTLVFQAKKFIKPNSKILFAKSMVIMVAFITAVSLAVLRSFR